MAERGDINDVGILRMHANRADVQSVFETHILPGLARVGGFINAVAVRRVAADVRLAHADVNDIWIGFRNSDGAHRSGFELAIRNRLPGYAAIDGFPNSAAGGAEV